MLHKYGLTKSQEQAYDEIAAWYANPSQPVHVLSGYAGSGKTFLINRLAKHLFSKNICVTAPTHRALRVVESSTGLKGKTIHALNGLRPNTNLDDFRIDNIKFDPMGEQQMRKYKVLVADESSMINDHLDMLMSTNAKNFGVKLLYVGDDCQLPPIKQKESTIFKKYPMSKLTDIVRQTNDNPIKDLLNILRDDIANGSSNFLTYLKSVKTLTNDKNEGFVTLNAEDFTAKTLELFNNVGFTSNTDFCRYLAFTNDSIGVWNDYIRKSTVTTDKIVHRDDLFTAYKTIVDSHNSTVLVNSEDYIIVDLVERLTDYKFKVFQTTLMQVSTGFKVKTNIVDHTDDTFVRFVEHLTRLLNNTLGVYGSARGRAFRDYFSFKDENLTLVDFQITNEEGAISNVYKELDYGYGITVHKAQGSTIKNPLINLINMCYYNNDISTPIRNTSFNPNAIDFRNRLVYTAMSRVSQTAYVLL